MADPAISPPEVTSAAPLEHSRRQLEALLEVAESIARHRDLAALFHDLAERLHCVVDFDFLTLVLHDPVRKVMRLHILETRLPTPVKTERNPDGRPSFRWVGNHSNPSSSATRKKINVSNFSSGFATSAFALLPWFLPPPHSTASVPWGSASPFLSASPIPSPVHAAWAARLPWLLITRSILKPHKPTAQLGLRA
jgi:hypothetical protein